MTEPLTPADCDLRDFPHMQLDVLRLRDSDLAAVPDAEVFRAAVLSWCVAWHQVPAASLPDDDAALCRLLGYGRDIKTWQKIRAAGALRGYVTCSDGRLYHPVVAEKAVDAWQKKRAQRDRTEAARLARLSQRLSQTPAGSVTDNVTESKGEERERRGEESTSSLRSDRRKTRVSPDWWPDDNGIAFASERQISPDIEAPRFRDHHIAKGSLMVDWAAAWRTWVQNAVKFRGDKPKPNGANAHDLLAGRWGDDRITEEKGRPVVNGYYVDHVSERLADITGLAVSPSDRIMVQWLADGYEPDEFMPVVRRLAERADGVSTLAYFDRAVREQRPTSKPMSQEAR